MFHGFINDKFIKPQSAVLRRLFSDFIAKLTGPHSREDFTMADQHTTQTTTTFNVEKHLLTVLAPFFIPGIVSILLSTLAILLNLFVLNYYRKSDLTIVSLLYTVIACVDIVTAIGIAHQSVTFSLFSQGKICSCTLDANAIVFYLIIQISYRSSVFYNLLLAVSRTIAIVKPLYQINIRAVKLVCVLCVLPWIVLAGFDIQQNYFLHRNYGNVSFTQIFYLDYARMGFGLANIVLGLELVNTTRWYIIAILPDLLAFLFPVIIIIFTCILQVSSLSRPSRFSSTSSNQRHVTSSNQRHVTSSNQRHVSSSNQRHVTSSNQRHVTSSNQRHVTSSNQRHVTSSNQRHVTSSNQRHVTITIILISLIFVVCNFALTAYLTLIDVLFLSGQEKMYQYLVYTPNYVVISAVLGTVLPVLNAALNPIIVISRSNGLSQEFRKTFKRIVGRVAVFGRICANY